MASLCFSPQEKYAITVLRTPCDIVVCLRPKLQSCVILLLKPVDTDVIVCCACLVGNKDDSPDRKQVDPQDARRFADQMGIQLFETSAKENINVEEVRLTT